MTGKTEIKEVEFYTMNKYNGMDGVVKRTGIEFEIKGIKLYAYVLYGDTAHIILPDIGCSVIKKEVFYYPEFILDCISDDEIEMIKKQMDTPAYERMVKVFDLYKKAAAEFEKHLILAKKEQQMYIRKGVEN